MAIAPGLKLPRRHEAFVESHETKAKEIEPGKDDKRLALLAGCILALIRIHVYACLCACAIYMCHM